jgi:hypothetical protein
MNQRSIIYLPVIPQPSTKGGHGTPEGYPLYPVLMPTLVSGQK